MVAVSGVTGGALLALLETALAPLGLPQFQLLLAVPGLACVALATGLLAGALLVPSIKRSQQPWEP